MGLLWIGLGLVWGGLWFGLGLVWVGCGLVWVGFCCVLWVGVGLVCVGFGCGQIVAERRQRVSGVWGLLSGACGVWPGAHITEPGQKTAV